MTRDSQNRLFASVLVHLVMVAVYFTLNDLGVDIYTSIYGPLRGYGVGLNLLTGFLFHLFAATNLVIALVPGLKVKLGLVLALVLINGVWLLPHHPIRALANCSFDLLIPLTAIFLSRRLHRHCTARDQACGLQQPVPGSAP